MFIYFYLQIQTFNTAQLVYVLKNKITVCNLLFIFQYIK
jgi:hypothetical protein